MQVAGKAWPRITVFGASWCRDTQRTLRLLRRYAVPFTYVDVDEDEVAARRVMEWNGGYLSTPTLVIGDRVLAEPSDEGLVRLLGLGSA